MTRRCQQEGLLLKRESVGTPLDFGLTESNLRHSTVDGPNMRGKGLAGERCVRVSRCAGREPSCGLVMVGAMEMDTVDERGEGPAERARADREDDSPMRREVRGTAWPLESPRCGRGTTETEAAVGSDGDDLCGSRRPGLVGAG